MNNQIFLKLTFIPLLLFACFTPWSQELDQTVANFFYQHPSYSQQTVVQWLYHYGFYPAWVVAAIGCFLLFKRQRQRVSCFLLVTLLVGPGLIVHAVLKDHWGRPRPRQVIEYGGTQPFRAYYQPNFTHDSKHFKSFPSGHCAMGFYFFAVAFLGRYYGSKRLLYSGLLMALGLGGSLSYARMAQGGHFLSDVLFSALIVWLTTIWTYYFMLEGKNYERAYV